MTSIDVSILEEEIDDLKTRVESAKDEAAAAEEALRFVQKEFADFEEAQILGFFDAINKVHGVLRTPHWQLRGLQRKWEGLTPRHVIKECTLYTTDVLGAEVTEATTNGRLPWQGVARRGSHGGGGGTRYRSVNTSKDQTPECRPGLRAWQAKEVLERP